MGAYVTVSFILYLLLMLGIGIYFSRKTVDLGDYYLGGRRMGKWVVALSAQAFGPIILLALFWRRATLAGAVSGMVAGAAATFIWKFKLSALAEHHPVFGIYELAPGFAICLLVAVVVSLVGKPPSNEALEEFDRIAKG